MQDFARPAPWPECEHRNQSKVGGEKWLHSVSVWPPCAVAHVCVSSSTQHTGWETKAYLIAEDFVSQKSWLFNNPPGYFLVPSVSFWKHERTCPSSTIYSRNNGQYRNTPIHPVELYITIKGCAGTPPLYRLTSSVADLCNRCSCYA